MENANKKCSKNVPKIFICHNCDYKCSKQSILDKHFLTRKHLMLTNANKKCSKNIDGEEFICNCGKIFKHKSSMSRHKKICNINDDNNTENNIDISNNFLKQIVSQVIDENNQIKNILLKENSDFKKIIMKQQDQIGELIPKIGNNNTNIQQKFNINIFLNEECKEAINMNDFIKSIEISLEQLDIIKNKGLVDGLSNTIVENMSKLSLHKRPLHCTDEKREILYIKNDDVWEKDTKKTHIKQAIKDLSNKQYKTLLNWTKANPDFKEDIDKQEYFSKAVSEIGKISDAVDEKIIKNLCSNYYLKDDLPNNEE